MQNQKKLMLLGGLRYLIPVIEAAHKLGIYVITCDYLPDNVAHKYADEYCNVSILDKEAVLEVAKRLKIDGIMSFAVDPGVITASYVAEKLGLPQVGPYESVCILQNKDRFRQFLSEHGFNVPKAKGFSTIEEALEGIEGFSWPLIVKPTDSAGSKGVKRVNFMEELRDALEYAFTHSYNKRVIVEEFIEQEGCSSDSDCFSVDGELKFVSFSAQYFDTQAANPYAPAAFSWPSTMTKEQESELTSELQRLLTLLKMKTSIYNVETRIGKNGKAYIMEVSPRGGGNRLSEMIRLSTGVDLITNAIKAAIGGDIDNLVQKECKECWGEIILHADESGNFKQLMIADDVKACIKEIDLWVNTNDRVDCFEGANAAIGTLVIQTSSEQSKSLLCHIKDWLQIAIF